MGMIEMKCNKCKKEIYDESKHHIGPHSDDCMEDYQYKTTTPYPLEYAYDCPHCGNKEYLGGEIADEDLGEHTCDKCKKKYILVKK